MTPSSWWGPMGGTQATGDLNRIAHRCADRKGTGPEPPPQRLTLEQLGNQVQGAFRRPDIVDGEDVRMVQRASRPGLSLEAEQPMGSAVSGNSVRAEWHGLATRGSGAEGPPGALVHLHPEPG